MNILPPLMIGAAFGWALHRGGMTQYAKVASVFRFEDLTLIKFLHTAVATGTFVLQSIVALGFGRSDMPVSASHVFGNALGGVIVGAGMALGGLCPATVVAGAGEGRLDSLVAGGAGLFAGAVLFGAAYPSFMPKLARIAAMGRTTIPQCSASTHGWSCCC